MPSVYIVIGLCNLGMYLGRKYELPSLQLNINLARKG